MRFLSIALVAGCELADAPCDEPGGCPGTVVVDLSGDAPSFSMEGTGDVVPDVLSVVHRLDCSDRQTVWDVDDIPDLGDPIVYGELPDRATEQLEPVPLEEGGDYEVLFMKTMIFGGTLGVEGWSAIFTWGEPGSVRSEDPDCL